MTPTPRLSTILRWSPVLLWYGAILLVSSISGRRLDDVGIDVPDKLVHAVEYGVLGFLIVRQRFLVVGRPALRAVLGAMAVVAVLGAIDEIYQGFVPHRTPSVADWIADVVGAAAGAWIATRFRRPPPTPVPSAGRRTRGPR